MLFAARLGTARGDLATGYELEIITIVLLGGVSIFGGSGRMSGVLLAVLIVLNLRNGFGLANVGGNTQTGVIGLILIGSVVAQNVIDRLGHRIRAPDPPTAPVCPPAGGRRVERMRTPTRPTTTIHREGGTMKLHRTVAVFGAIALFAAACGSDDDSGSDTTAAAGTEAPASEAPATEAPAGSEAPAGLRRAEWR